MPFSPESLSCKVLRLTPVPYTGTKIRATFDLSIGDGLITIIDCRLVDRHGKEGQTVYGPSVPRTTGGTYPRFVRFEPPFLEHVVGLAQAELLRQQSGEAIKQ